MAAPDPDPTQGGWIVGDATPLMEIQSTVMPLSIVFDCVAYLRDGHEEVEMFDMIQRLKAACE